MRAGWLAIVVAACGGSATPAPAPVSPPAAPRPPTLSPMCGGLQRLLDAGRDGTFDLLRETLDPEDPAREQTFLTLSGAADPCWIVTLDDEPDVAACLLHHGTDAKAATAAFRDAVEAVRPCFPDEPPRWSLERTQAWWRLAPRPTITVALREAYDPMFGGDHEYEVTVEVDGVEP